MTGKGTLTRKPRRQIRWMLTFQLLWLGMVFVLGSWWGWLVVQQAARIDELEDLVAHDSHTGVTSTIAGLSVGQTRRMVVWESGTFLVLLVACTVLLFVFYWRDSKRSRALQAFFASVTHELRTPLTSIRLQAESIAENLGQAGSSDLRLVRRLLEDTLRLESQVERTLELARVEGGGPVYSQPLQLKPWLERMLQPWREATGERASVLNSLDDVWVEADPRALNVILKNLLENSLKHSQREPVEVRIVSERKPGGEVLVKFEDNGLPFEGQARLLGKIYEKGPHSQGAGVGLYLAKMLMERMGGTLEFTTSPGFVAVLRFREAHG